MKEFFFNMHGIIVRLRSDSATVARCVKEEIREFESKPSTPEVSVHFQSTESSSRAKQSIKKHEQITDTIYSHADLNNLSGIVTGRDKFSRDDAVLVTLSLIGYLARYVISSRRRAASLHSASVALFGRGALLSGDSGAGKTTISASFIKEGFSYLSDEDSLVEIEGETPHILSFPRNLRLGESFAKSIEGKQFLKSYNVKQYEAVYEKGYILDPREINRNCIAKKSPLCLFAILRNSPDFERVRINHLDEISSLYRVVSLSELMTPDEIEKGINAQIRRNNRSAFEIANFIFDRVPLYEIKYNLEKHFEEIPFAVKGLLEKTYEK